MSVHLEKDGGNTRKRSKMSLFKLPFSEEFLKDIAGKTFVLASNFRGQNKYTSIKELMVKDDDGTCNDKISFKVVNGLLRLYDRGNLFCTFSEIGTNGVVSFFVGYSDQEVTKSGHERFVLYEKICLSDVGFGICISSHVDYEKKTLPVILASLKKTGFDMGRVLVVIGGDKRNDGNSEVTEDGVSIVRRSIASMGFVALSEVNNMPRMEYWALSHDTCEMDKDFFSKMGTLDVGLMQDIVLFRPVEDESEIGLYRTDFINSSGIDVGAKAIGMLTSFIRAAGTMTVIKGTPVTGQEKDVYGDGHKRRVIALPSVGIRKYEGRTARGGRP